MTNVLFNANVSARPELVKSSPFNGSNHLIRSRSSTLNPNADPFHPKNGAFILNSITDTHFWTPDIRPEGSYKLTPVLPLRNVSQNWLISLFYFFCMKLGVKFTFV